MGFYLIFKIYIGKVLTRRHSGNHRKPQSGKLTISSCVSVRMSRYWASGKFGEHERGVNSNVFRALQTSHVLNIIRTLTHELIVNLSYCCIDRLDNVIKQLAHASTERMSRYWALGKFGKHSRGYSCSRLCLDLRYVIKCHRTTRLGLYHKRKTRLFPDI